MRITRHTEGETSARIRSIDSPQSQPRPPETADRYEMASGTIAYHGETEREWIRFDPSLEASL